MSRLAATEVGLTRDGATLLSGLSISFEAGETVAIVGPNGAGKSLFLKLLAGIERPTSGGILLGGRTMSAYSARERARYVGYVPQHFQPHWDLTVADLLQLGAERTGTLSPGMAKAALEDAGLTSLQNRRWSALSGGERARTLLAAVLIARPPIVLADEPAASLDVRHRIETCKTLTAQRNDRLTIVVLHDLDLAFKFFDRVVLVEGGRVVADAPAGVAAYDEAFDRAFGIAFQRLAEADGIRLQPVLR
ncbi:MAG: ABC transporter ATP-binding protein [Xanthobacteraceae bacterium]|nr:ABC transporter ATP-binding protein [Xanthobacteraceae bacterium]